MINKISVYILIIQCSVSIKTITVHLKVRGDFNYMLQSYGFQYLLHKSVHVYDLITVVYDYLKRLKEK